MIRKQIFCILYLVACMASAQAPEKPVHDDSRKYKRPAYLSISVGISSASFRDFATSPLRYSGRPLYLSLAHLDFDAKRTSSFHLAYSFGEYPNDFNDHQSVSKVRTLSMNYQELFQFKSIQSEQWNLQVGGQFNATANHRENTLLQNNGEGVDIIATLFGSVQLTRYLKTKKAWKNNQLSYTFHAGLINSAYRNGFAYINLSALLNNDAFFDDYHFELFAGFRLASALNYTFFLKNHNALQVSYLWDAYHTGKDKGELEMATHTLKFALLFNLNESK